MSDLACVRVESTTCSPSLSSLGLIDTGTSWHCADVHDVACADHALASVSSHVGEGCRQVLRRYGQL